MDCAFFPYGLKSKEFLIKRSIYLIEYLENICDKIIIACNTLSLLIMPYVNKYYSNVFGVFESLEPYINEKTGTSRCRPSIPYHLILFKIYISIFRVIC